MLVAWKPGKPSRLNVKVYGVVVFCRLALSEVSACTSVSIADSLTPTYCLYSLVFTSLDVPHVRLAALREIIELSEASF